MIRSAAPGGMLTFPQPDFEGIAQPVADEVEGADNDHDGQDGRYDHPPVAVEGVVDAVAAHAAPVALVEQLAATGHAITSPSELVDLVHGGDPAASLAVRTAGWHLGEVLAVVVNFFNPEVLVLGGMLASADPLIASLRAAIYDHCLPMASEAVTITTASSADAGLAGAA